jgi:hypothetical protein
VTQNKTVQTDVSVDEFVASIAHPTRRQEAAVLVDLFSNVTGYAQKCGATVSLDLVNIIIAMPQAAMEIFWQRDFHRANPICRFILCQDMVIFPAF